MIKYRKPTGLAVWLCHIRLITNIKLIITNNPQLVTSKGLLTSMPCLCKVRHFANSVQITWIWAAPGVKTTFPRVPPSASWCPRMRIGSSAGDEDGRWARRGQCFVFICNVWWPLTLDARSALILTLFPRVSCCLWGKRRVFCEIRIKAGHRNQSPFCTRVSDTHTELFINSKLHVPW